MKRITATVMVSLLLLGGCSVSRQRERGVSEYAPLPNRAMARRSKVSLETLETGHGIYMRKCGECHTHLLPDEITSEDWHVIVPGMAWNAGIDPSEETALMKYLIAAKNTPQPSNPDTP